MSPLSGTSRCRAFGLSRHNAPLRCGDRCRRCGPGIICAIRQLIEAPVLAGKRLIFVAWNHEFDQAIYKDVLAEGLLVAEAYPNMASTRVWKSDVMASRRRSMFFTRHSEQHPWAVIDRL